MSERSQLLTPAESSRRWWTRKLAFVALVPLLLGVFYFATRRQPVEIEARYDLSGQRDELTSLSVSWCDDERRCLDAQFRYAGVRPPIIESHDFELPRGAYRVRAVLAKRNGTAVVVERDATIDDAGVVELSLGP